MLKSFGAIIKPARSQFWIWRKKSLLFQILWTWCKLRKIFSFSPCYFTQYLLDIRLGRCESELTGHCWSVWGQLSQDTQSQTTQGRKYSDTTKHKYIVTIIHLLLMRLMMPQVHAILLHYIKLKPFQVLDYLIDDARNGRLYICASLEFSDHTSASWWTSQEWR